MGKRPTSKEDPKVPLPPLPSPAQTDSSDSKERFFLSFLAPAEKKSVEEQEQEEEESCAPLSVGVGRSCLFLFLTVGYGTTSQLSQAAQSHTCKK